MRRQVDEAMLGGGSVWIEVMWGGYAGDGQTGDVWKGGGWIKVMWRWVDRGGQWVDKGYARCR